MSENTFVEDQEISISDASSELLELFFKASQGYLYRGGLRPHLGI